MIKFVVGKPALLVEKSLVIGDLHLGIEEKLEKKGINIGSLSHSMGAEARKIFEESGAERMVILGDVKDEIGYPTKAGYSSMREFFGELSRIRITIVKGNHDAHIREVLSSIGVDCTVEKELLLNSAALVHGHAYPSKEALKKRYLIIGHGHIAYGPLGGSIEKVWLIAESKKKKKLIIMPAFNPLITGSNIANWDTDMMIFRAGSFDARKAKVYSLQGELLGTLGELSKQG
ncbi:MAG: metallophosphoesterase [Candidatus Micrarchaeia archaeon]|jgi:putative SbcD/Mre11-related phosphoesterase